MYERISVRVAAADPVSEAGVAAQLRSRPEVLSGSIRKLRQIRNSRCLVSAVVA